MSILDDYTPKVKRAIPKVSDYRERYKKGKVRIEEVKVFPKVLTKLPRQDKFLDSISYKGDSLFFGKGVEQEY